MRFTNTEPVERSRWFLPETIRIRERPPDATYRSILGEWGHYGRAAIYEKLSTPVVEQVQAETDDNDSRADAKALALNQTVQGAVLVGEDEDWYRIDVPGGDNHLSLDIQGNILIGTVLLISTLLTGVGVGMFVSSMVRTEVTAISTLPLLLLPQLILAGYLQLYKELSTALQYLSAFMPVRWGFEGLLHAEYWALEIFDGEKEEGMPIDSDADIFHNLQETIGFENSFAIAFLWLVSVTLLATLATLLRLRQNSE